LCGDVPRGRTVRPSARFWTHPPRVAHARFFKRNRALEAMSVRTEPKGKEDVAERIIRLINNAAWGDDYVFRDTLWDVGNLIKELDAGGVSEVVAHIKEKLFRLEEPCPSAVRLVNLADALEEPSWPARPYELTEALSLVLSVGELMGMINVRRQAAQKLDQRPKEAYYLILEGIGDELLKRAMSRIGSMPKRVPAELIPHSDAPKKEETDSERFHRELAQFYKKLASEIRRGRKVDLLKLSREMKGEFLLVQGETMDYADPEDLGVIARALAETLPWCSGGDEGQRCQVVKLVNRAVEGLKQHEFRSLGSMQIANNLIIATGLVEDLGGAAGALLERSTLAWLEGDDRTRLHAIFLAEILKSLARRVVAEAPYALTATARRSGEDGSATSGSAEGPSPAGSEKPTHSAPGGKPGGLERAG